MKFTEMEYFRPNIKEACAKLEVFEQNAKNAQTGQQLLAAYNNCQKLTDDIGTAATIATVRHTVNTEDTFYNGENDYFDENAPIISDKVLNVYRAILANPNKKSLEEKYGKILPEKLEINVKSSDKRLLSLQQEENALGTKYEKLYASAKINFDGGQFTVAQLAPFKQSTNRQTRIKAFEAEGGFFDQNQQELDEIYDKLVINRTKQANIMGFESFTPLGDIRMERHGYTRNDICVCRNEVVHGIVPFAEKIKVRQAQRLGLSDFKFYDDLLFFEDGNPKPKGSPEEILAAGQKMYRGLSTETAQFIDFMMDGGLFDVLAKPGKAPGGYCTYIPNYKSPFIFANFNGTAGDVDVLTHEAGHAFAAYMAAKQNLPQQLLSPGLESCEIHSMSMEFLTSDYHHLFFGDKTQKYSLNQAESCLVFIPYGCQVDEFQEIVYKQPGLSPLQRNKLWLELERKYRPWNDFAGLPFYSRGAGWQRQMHIYGSPFYYIDYVLAQAIALQFFLANLNNKKSAWQKYLALLNKAGTETYSGLVQAAGLKTPFEKGALSQIGQDVYSWISQKQ